MQNFFDQVKTLLADDITYFEAEKPNCVYIELKYRDNKVEVDYNSGSYGAKNTPGSINASFMLSIDLGSSFELEILPKSFIDRLFDVPAGVSLFDGAKKIVIKIPSLEHEILLHTNNEEIARNFVLSPDVSNVISDYGLTFFKIVNGELKVYLNELSTERFEELRSNPSLFKGYLDILVDLSGHLKT